MPYVCDFETITTEPTRVWLWAICDVDNTNAIIWGKTIDSYIDEVSKNKYKNEVFYFHNLKFDGMFLVYELLAKRGFIHSTGKLDKNEFSTIISRQGQWYQLKFNNDGKTITIRDSLKKLPFSVKNLSNSFDLDEYKGDIDYNLCRPEGYNPTDEELDYVKRDVRIVAKALKTQLSQGLTRMTIGSDALKDFKDRTGKFRTKYPLLSADVDAFCRLAYKGGYVYCADKYQGFELRRMGSVYDVNSMYPWAMRYCPMPYGKPYKFIGEYEYDADYPLYITQFEASFKLKKGKLPTVQVRNDKRFLAREYIKDSEVDERSPFVTLTLTNIDLELFFECYNVYEINYIDGYKFRSSLGSFNEYIDYWMEVKENNTGAIRTLAKLMLNNLYGKFAKNPDVTGKHPYIHDDGTVRLKDNEKEIGETNYVPVACFVTAYSRDKLIRSALACGDRFLYCDTDSLHVLGLNKPNIEIHDSKLGAWKRENVFKNAKFLHAKCYTEQIYYESKKEGVKLSDRKMKLKITVSGLPDRCKNQVTIDNFVEGKTYKGKYVTKSVIGGVILLETTFKINKNAWRIG